MLTIKDVFDKLYYSRFYDNSIFSDLLKQGFMPKSGAPTGAPFFMYWEGRWHLEL